LTTNVLVYTSLEVPSTIQTCHPYTTCILNAVLIRRVTGQIMGSVQMLILLTTGWIQIFLIDHGYYCLLW